MTQHLDPRILVELPDNPRYIDGDDFERLCESITRNPDLFNARPILCSDRTGELVVIGGNQRLKAALHLGLATVPVFVFSGLSVEREREIAVRDNVTNGEWDATKLESWAECDLVGWGVDIGFDFDRLTDLPEYKPEGDNTKTNYSAKEDDYEQPEPETIKTAIIVGDLITFEKDGVELHRLICGDSTDAETVARLMAGEKADMVFTDPPYGIDWNTDYTRFVGGKVASEKHEKIANDEKEFDPKYWIDNFDKCLFFGANCFSDKLPKGNWIVWDKRFENEVALLADAEVAWYNGTGAIYIIKEVCQGFVNSDGKKSHPTQKPVALFIKIFHKIKAPNVLLDPYLGSGTTMLAAHKTDRRCYGLELEPRYNYVIIKRMLKLDNSLIVKINGIDQTQKYLE